MQEAMRLRDSEHTVEELTWYRQTPHDRFRINHTDPNTGFRAGWRQDEDIPGSDGRISSTLPRTTKIDGVSRLHKRHPR
jgi:hypothetical protein